MSTFHASPPRVLFYSHDSIGLGHFRRNLTIAESLVGSRPGARALLVNSSPAGTGFQLSPGIDLVKLPSISKGDDGRYRPRTLGAGLDSILEIRGRLLESVVESFEPDVFVVDHKVLGVHGEIAPALRAVRRQGGRTLLGLRDVIDAPDRVALEWSPRPIREALARDYDRVCVYGSSKVYDPRVEYPVPPELRDRVEFGGYVVRSSAPRAPRAIPALRPQVLVTVGGGEDGGSRIDCYLRALRLGRSSWDSVIVCGPMLDPREARRLKREARMVSGVVFHRFHADLPELIGRSDAVCAMAGYNTCAEILAARKPAVFLPRRTPRVEQAIRAERLERLGLGRSVAENDPVVLRHALERALSSHEPVPWTPPMDGAAYASRVILALAEDPVALAQG